MTALLMITVFGAWLLYCFVFSGGNRRGIDDLHYTVPDIDDEAAPLNPTAAREVADVLAAPHAELAGVISERR